MISKVQRSLARVTSAGYPIQVEQSITYTTKGVPMAMTIHSKTDIFTDPASGKIEKVVDGWNTSLPDGSMFAVHLNQLISPGWWLYYAEGWAWWVWSFVWWTPVWEVCFAHLDA